MRVLLIGSGGREDALAWAVSRSPLVERLRCAPGNAGMQARAECVDIAADDVAGLTAHCRREGYDLVIVGPEGPLVGGIAERLSEAGIAVFGPGPDAARMEGSKAFAKRFMTRHGIPTADYRVFDDPAAAQAWLSAEASYPLVVKADGLAAGKGVILADTREVASAAVEQMMIAASFGDAGSTVVIEECLRGREVSFFVLADGERAVELATCQDYKRALDGDQGPNTGGMGTYSPSAYLDPSMRRTIVESIVNPTIAGLAAEGQPYRGVLYVGVMLTDHGPRVLEYNVRFGDPETQVLVPRLDGDWVVLLHACATGTLDAVPLPRWKDGAAVCVVMASDGYPSAYTKGQPIVGVDEADRREGVEVFHAGTARDATGALVTAGGRVLGVTALGVDLAEARRAAYEAVDRIRWKGARYRTDIALDAIQRMTGGVSR